MIFRPRQKTLSITKQIIKENNALGQVDNIKFLGVYINQHLTWKTHVNFFAAKISKSVGLLYKAKCYLPSKSLLTLYYALIYPYLTYCNLIWASTYVTNMLFSVVGKFVATSTLMTAVTNSPGDL